MIQAEKLETATTPGTKRRLKRVQALVGLVLLGVVVGLGLYLSSDSFRQRVQARIVAELEHMTGGRVELQSFTWNLSKLRFEARGLTIHGLEGSGEEPYVHADRISVRLKIISFLSRQVALREVVLDRLAVHLIVAADGTTNQPAPKTAQGGAGISADQLFDLAVSRVEINSGTLLLNQERIPFDLAGERFSASMNYSRAEHGYEGVVAASLLAAHWRNSPPVNGEVNFHFLMRAGETQFKSLKIAAGKSAVDAIGSLRNYNHPEVDLHYTASLDLLEVAKQFNIPELRAGRADLKGHLNYRAHRFSSEGQADARALSWSDPSLPLHASGVDVSSTFTLTPEKLTLPRFTARIFGGSAQGDLQIANWKAGGKQPSPQKGILNLQLSRVQIGEVASAVSSARLPLNKVDLAGSATGDIKTNWTGALKNSISEIMLDVDPPAAPSAREVPVTAHMRATYRGNIRTLDIGGLNLGTRAIHVNVVGTLGSRSARGHLAVNATSLHEVQPILDALRPGSRLPISVAGRATFNGTVFGDLDALSANGHVELENFETEVGFSFQPAQGSAPAPPPRIHWDSLVSDVGYSPSGVILRHGALRRGKAQVGFSGTIGLSHGSFDEATSPLSLDLHLANLPVEDVQTLAGLHYPVTGVAGIDVHATGTARDLRGGGNLQIAKLTVYGEPFQAFRSQLQLVGREVQFTNLALSHNGAQLTGNFAYDVGASSFRFDVAGAGIELASLQSLQAPRLALEGKAGFHLTGSGAGTGTPAISGRLDVANFKLNHEALGAISAVIETRGPQLVVRGRANFEDASLNLDGSVEMRSDYPAQMTLQFVNVDFDPLLRAYFQGLVAGHSSIAGSADIHGPLRRPRDLSLTGTVSQLAADIGNVKVQNEGPIRLSMDHETVRAQQFHLVGQDTDFFVQGSLGVAAEHALELHTRGRFNLRLAQGFNPNILAYGPANFTVDVGGTIAHPHSSGRFELVDAGVSLVDLPNGLSHINGTMVFAQDRIQIEKLTAHSGGGELNLGGFLAYRNGFFFDLTATGKDVRLRYPPGVSASADASLRYTGSAKSSQLSGDITVTRFGLNPRFDFGGVLLRQSKTPLGMTSLNPFLDNLRLDIHVLSTPELRVETSLAKVSGDVDLRVRGSAARPAVLGRVNIAEGDVSFNGTKYRLERGDITFSNPLVIEPVVNIEMSARVQNYDITVGLHGPLTGSGLRLTYRSDPPLSNSDIISLLAFGQPRGQDVYNASAQPGQSGQTAPEASAANAVLGQALDAAVSNRVERLFGASRVKIDPEFIGQQNNPSARVTVEQTINNNITLTYVTSLAQSAQTVIQVEYAVDKNVSIVAVRDRNGVLGFDVHIRRRTK